MSPVLIVEEHEDRVVLRLTRPEVRPAIDLDTVKALQQVRGRRERKARAAWLTGSDGVSAAAADITSVFHAPREAHPPIDDLGQAVQVETQGKHDRMTAFLERRKGRP